MDNRFIDWKHSARHRKLLSKEFRIERNHQIVLAFDTGHLMAEPIGKLTRLDHAIHAGLQLGWVALRTGDFVGEFGFDARVRHYASPQRGVRSFVGLQRGAAHLGYFPEETNYTLGLAELNARLKRRALVVLFTEFVDTTTAQLHARRRQAHVQSACRDFRHLLRSAACRNRASGAQRRFPMSRARLSPPTSCASARWFSRSCSAWACIAWRRPARGLAVSLVNRYLQIKGRGLL